MIRDLPPNARKILQAFAAHANNLLEENPKSRNENTLYRFAEQIFSPHDHEQEKPLESRQTTFLRDYFNSFREVQLACEHLDITKALIRNTLETCREVEMARLITYWAETYLNDIYIFNLRITDFLTFTERKYSKDEDFAAPTKEICTQLGSQIFLDLKPLLKIRGAHVHESRTGNFDPILVRLSHLSLLAKDLGNISLADEYRKGVKEAEQWLLQQIDHFSEVAWVQFDAVCEVLAHGLVTENGWLIVPQNYKDSPKA